MVPLLIIVTISVTAALFAAGGAGLRERRWPRSLPQAFPCRFAIEPDDRHSAVVRWERGTSYGVWVHDVLVIYSGVWRTRARPFHVEEAGDIRTVSARTVSGLGEAPDVFPLQLADGRHAWLATAGGSEDALAGPFLAAALARRLRSTSDR
jgi:hypothetical protein